MTHTVIVIGIFAGYFLQLMTPNSVPFSYASVFFFPAFLFYGISRMSPMPAIITAGVFGVILDATTLAPLGFYTSSFLIGASIMGVTRMYVRIDKEWLRLVITGVGLTASMGVTILLRLAEHAPQLSVNREALILQVGVIILLAVGRKIIFEMLTGGT
jgi:cell shape-determining protein MreD